ncbi:alpha-ribazole phosphatase [Orenia marismortui]|uniref:Alpha-ribazole phosphatase n=1 Tax=Orenia marismortui TaxID=46469 RepID=A0A4R8H0Y4_9FIRM|nr:alpha-ribazole phosphatase [Orenia marismortui]TDX52984.1 alpha-ribazole phosphatase/probable phosphoglycerate mutase [Orenia marismortui]
MGTKLILIRHGETKWNKAGRFQGNKDIELNSAGRKQAEKLGKGLADEKIDAIYSSNLSRAYETAQILSQEHGLEVKSYSSLQEINFGVWEGLTFDEIMSEYEDEFRNWQSSSSNRPPQGESLEDVRERVVKKIKEIIANHREETIAIVAHGGVNKILLSTFLELPLDKSWRLMQSNTAVNILSFYEDDIILELLNSTAHLHD